MLKAIEEEALEQLKGFGDQFFGLLDDYELTIDDFSYKKKGVAGYFLKKMKGTIEEKMVNSYVAGCMGDATKWTSKTHKRKNDIVALAERELIPLLKTAEEFRS